MAGGAQMIRATQRLREGVARIQGDSTLEDDAILDEIHREHQESMPKATKSAYATPQREYRQWCLKKAVEKDGKKPLEAIAEGNRALEEVERTLVTGKRAAMFFRECVVDRPHKQRGRGPADSEKGKKKAPANTPDPAKEITGEERTVGWKTLEAYLCALCYMQKQQEHSTGRTLDSPRRHPSVIELMATLKRRNAERKKSSFVDRCQDSFLDGYHKTEQLANILNAGLIKDSPSGIRDRTMAALSHYGLLRGEDARGIQLPDVQHLPMDHREGPTQCDIMVILLLDGKTNQTGNTQYMGAMRNKEWEVCPIGAMAMWFFYRFQISGETFGPEQDSFPRMDNSSQWYPIWLFTGKLQNTPISPDAHAKATRTLLENAGVRQHSKKVTHIFRGSGARMADLFGASETDIRRGGRWDMSSMAQHYLTTLPRETMRVLGGFPPTAGRFWLGRDLV